MGREIRIIMAYIIGIGLIVFGLSMLAWWNSRYNCNRLATDSGLQTKFDWRGQGCFVKIGNKYVQEDNWRGIAGVEP
jgi:hypothetical protein